MIRAQTAMGLALLLVLPASQAAAEPTEVTVRVLARGAKFVGSSLGGMEITIRDVDTGALLARGTTQGTTGDTQKIMRARRWAPLATPGAAAFTATLELDEPRLVEISAYGPRAQRQAAVRASVMSWLVPGRHVSGDGIVLEVPGFVVDVLAPPAHVQLGRAQTVTVNANVMMMCGCPLTPGGTWDASKVTVRARVERDEVFLGEVPLRYAGQASQFTGTVNARERGVYRVVVYAYDPQSGNTGVDTTTFIVN